jgi:hypothetical protein
MSSLLAHQIVIFFSPPMQPRVLLHLFDVAGVVIMREEVSVTLLLLDLKRFLLHPIQLNLNDLVHVYMIAQAVGQYLSNP